MQYHENDTIFEQGSTITFCIHWPGGPVDFKSYWPPPPPPKSYWPELFLQEYTFILIKTGTLYTNIYLFIFRTLKIK